LLLVFLFWSVGKPCGFTLCRFDERLEQVHCTLRTNGKYAHFDKFEVRVFRPLGKFRINPWEDKNYV
jgi:hypothetical protein